MGKGRQRQTIQFIGQQETSSGCGLMGLGEKILSQIKTSRAQLHPEIVSSLVPDFYPSILLYITSCSCNE